MTTTTPDTSAATAAMVARIDARVEDLMFLIDHGVPTEYALERVDWHPAAAAKALRRRGHIELARAVDRARRARERGDLY